jgi:dTDP-4-amino-4,6-dideoxygalactose transaminase
VPEKIPFCDLTRALKPLGGAIRTALERTIDSGWFLRGPEIEAFEYEWAAYCGHRYCVSCASGTDALTIAALALRLREARVQANTLSLTATGLQRGGAKIVVCDVDDQGRLERPDADSVPVLLYGRGATSAEMRCRVFDAAHAHGWKPPAHALACWSFYPTKTLGALGDAGAVTTSDAGLADALRALCGRDDQLRDGRQITSRMDEMQAAILRIKLAHLDSWLAERRHIAMTYIEHLRDTVRRLPSIEDSFHHLFVIRVDKRDSLMRHLSDHDVETKVHFPQPLHRLNAAWGNAKIALPRAEAWCDSVLSLPCYPGLRDDEVSRICSLIKTWHGLG